MDTVYIETTVVGNVAGRIHPNPDIAARQRKTRRWCVTAKANYRLFISQMVFEECAAGDPSAAQERLNEIDELPRLDITDRAHELASALTSSGAIPPSEPRDALHIAVCAAHGIQYLVTWNFKHIANATLRGLIESVCRDNGFEPPIICTPEEIAGFTDDADDADDAD
jgi:predicted nucleic acid-binding protein